MPLGPGWRRRRLLERSRVPGLPARAPSRLEPCWLSQVIALRAGQHSRQVRLLLSASRQRRLRLPGVVRQPPEVRRFEPVRRAKAMR